MTLEEMMMLQGINPLHFIKATSDRAIGEQIGNAMSVNVVERLLYRVFKTTDLVCLFWSK